MNNESLAVLVLTSRLVTSGAKSFSAREIWQLTERLPYLAVIFESTAEDLSQHFGLRPADSDRIARLTENATATTFAIEQLEESGIKVLTVFDDMFPSSLVERLGRRSSAFVLVAGDLDLLAVTSRGIVGSRDASADAIEVANLAAHTAVSRGEHVVSGLAKGIDQAGMTAAIESGGKVIGISSEGIRRTIRSAEVRNLIHEGRMCLVSPFGPDARFTVGNAMGRNRFIYALSSSTLVVAADARKGGTWAGAEEALKWQFGQVDVWTGRGAISGNHELVASGATAVSDREHFWKQDFESSPPAIITDPEQLNLLD